MQERQFQLQRDPLEIRCKTRFAVLSRGLPVEQLVVPLNRRNEVIRLAHQTLQTLVWIPGVAAEIKPAQANDAEVRLKELQLQRDMQERQFQLQRDLLERQFQMQMEMQE